MKKWFLILMLLGIFGCATQPSKVAAITGYDSDYYARYIDPDENKITFAINVDGFVEGSNQEILIRGIHHVLTDQNQKIVTKAELLDAIRHQMVLLQLDYSYELVDFAPDAQLLTRDRRLLFANRNFEESVSLEDTIQEYLLKGHVILRKRVEEPITHPTETANIEYKVQFATKDGEFHPLPIFVDYGEKHIGEKLTSDEFRKIAEEKLLQLYPDYMIDQKEYTIIKHNSLGQLPRYYSYQDHFSYEIQDRQRIMAKDPKSGKELGETQSIDNVFEKYLITKKSYKP